MQLVSENQESVAASVVLGSWPELVSVLRASGSQGRSPTRRSLRTCTRSGWLRSAPWGSSCGPWPQTSSLTISSSQTTATLPTAGPPTAGGWRRLPRAPLRWVQEAGITPQHRFVQSDLLYFTKAGGHWRGKMSERGSVEVIICLRRLLNSFEHSIVKRY